MRHPAREPEWPRTKAGLPSLGELAHQAMRPPPRNRRDAPTARPERPMMPDPRSSATSVVRPLDLRNRSLVWQVGAVLFGTLILAPASWIGVPTVPVPMTMPSYAVVMIGAVVGWRLGGITTLVWLGQAAVGLPVLAGGSGGIAHFFGPTGGYLVAFPIIAAMVGWLTGRGWNGGRPLRAFAAMMLAHAICLGL